MRKLSLAWKSKIAAGPLDGTGSGCYIRGRKEEPNKMSEHIERAQGTIVPFLEALEAKIEQIVIVGNGILPATATAKEMAPAFGWEWSMAYHVLKLYVDARPELEIAKGPKGGVRKRTSVKPEQVSGHDDTST